MKRGFIVGACALALAGMTVIANAQEQVQEEFDWNIQSVRCDGSVQYVGADGKTVQTEPVSEQIELKPSEQPYISLMYATAQQNETGLRGPYVGAGKVKEIKGTIHAVELRVAFEGPDMPSPGLTVHSEVTKKNKDGGTSVFVAGSAKSVWATPGADTLQVQQVVYGGTALSIVKAVQEATQMSTYDQVAAIGLLHPGSFLEMGVTCTLYKNAPKRSQEKSAQGGSSIQLK